MNGHLKRLNDRLDIYKIALTKIMNDCQNPREVAEQALRRVEATQRPRMSAWWRGRRKKV